jgi:hypothetical protein
MARGAVTGCDRNDHVEGKGVLRPAHPSTRTATEQTSIFRIS